MASARTPLGRIEGRRTGAALLIGALAWLTGCDDDGSSESGPTVSATAAVCAAYADVEAAADDALAMDILEANLAELRRSLEQIEDSVATLAEEAGVDDSDIIDDIDDAVAELPQDPDLSDQLELNGVRDTRDIIVADVQKWLEDLDVDCP